MTTNHYGTVTYEGKVYTLTRNRRTLTTTAQTATWPTTHRQSTLMAPTTR
ncbi:MAG: hypothetical protein IPH54_17055 [Rhodoferax sp.]|nr:hypothetical protein [Rhodoferax sp.]